MTRIHLLWPLTLPPPAPSLCSSDTGTLALSETFQTHSSLRATALAIPSARCFSLRGGYTAYCPSSSRSPYPTTLNLLPCSIWAFFQQHFHLLTYHMLYSLITCLFVCFNSLSLTLGYKFHEGRPFRLPYVPSTYNSTWHTEQTTTNT